MKIIDNAVIKCCGECPNWAKYGRYDCDKTKKIIFDDNSDTIDPSCPLKEVEVIECAEAGIMFNTEKDHNVGPVKFYYDIEEIIIVKKQVAVSTPVK